MIHKNRIAKINQELTRLIKKMLYKNCRYSDLDHLVKDVIQHTWLALLQKYRKELGQCDEKAYKSLAYTIAKNECLRVVRESAKYTSLSNAVIPSRMLNNQEDEQRYAFTNNDFEGYLSILPNKLSFILKNALLFEEDHRQEQIVDILKEEYKNKYGTELTLDNYRKMKERARKKMQDMLRPVLK